MEQYKEHMEREPISGQLIYCINSYREAAMSNDAKFDHIDLANKQKVLNECIEAEAWLREKKHQQDALPKYAMPVLFSADVRKKAEALDRQGTLVCWLFLIYNDDDSGISSWKLIHYYNSSMESNMAGNQNQYFPEG